jgi:molybdate transport system ATP-binding protein
MEAAGDRVRVSVAGPPDVRADVDPACVAELGLADGTEVWAEVEPAEVEAYPDY